MKRVDTTTTLRRHLGLFSHIAVELRNEVQESAIGSTLLGSSSGEKPAHSTEKNLDVWVPKLACQTRRAHAKLTHVHEVKMNAAQ